MLSSPDAKVLEALANLENNGNFKIIMDWLNSNKVTTVTQMAVATDVTLYRAQGAFSVLESMHNHATGARGALVKLSTGIK